MDIRSKFEAWFTIEDGVHFDEDGDEYITTVEHKEYTESKLTQYAWEGYQQGVAEMLAQQVTDFGQLQTALESIDKLKAENGRLTIEVNAGIDSLHFILEHDDPAIAVQAIRKALKEADK